MSAPATNMKWELRVAASMQNGPYCEVWKLIECTFTERQFSIEICIFFHIFDIFIVMLIINV